MGQEGFLSPTLVAIGRIGAPYGVKGWAHVQSYTNPPDNILRYKTWNLQIKDKWQKVLVIEARAQGKSFVAALEGYETRESIAKLTNIEIWVNRQELPDLQEDDHYWVDLIGMTVITVSGEVLGTIDSLFETGSNDVVVVKGENKEYLIPYIPEDYIVEIDRESRIMRVSWDPEF